MKSLVKVLEGFYQNIGSIYCEPAQQRDFLPYSALRKLYIFPTLIDSNILNNIADTIYKLGLKADKKGDWRISFLLSSSDRPCSYISRFICKRVQEIFIELTKKVFVSKRLKS